MYRAFAIAAVLLSATPAFAQNDTGEVPAPAMISDDSFDAQFACPETIESADQRVEDLQHYMTWAKVNHPDWSLRKRLAVRYGLLRRHACTTTLANLAASALPPFPR
jgi:hypothetical protein